MAPVASRRIHVRAPGVKTGSRIGPLGPFRGTLGIHWVIGSIAVGLVILLATTWILFRAPGDPFVKVEGLTIEDVAPGTAREVLGGVFLGRTEDGRPIAVAEAPGCPLEVVEGGYLDCTEHRFGLDGTDRRGRTLTILPLQVHGEDVYIDTSGAG
jgi:hypothetical protein